MKAIRWVSLITLLSTICLFLCSGIGAQVLASEAFVEEGLHAKPEADLGDNGRRRANIRVTATGSAVLLGNQVLYFEGLDEQETDWIYQSFLYGGVASSILRNIGYYGTYALLPNQPGLLYGLLKSTRLVGQGLYYYFALSNIRHIWNTGAWYSLPATLSSLNFHTLLHWFGVPAKERHFYMLAAALKGIGSLDGAITQIGSKTTTQYLHVPLAGSAGKQFMVKAIFPADNKHSPLYEVNRIGLEAPRGNSGYQKLARVLAERGIDRIYISPEKSGENTLTTFFYDPARERNIKLAISGDFGQHADTPWLLNAIYLKQNRQALARAQSALAPSIISAIADAYNAFPREGAGQRQRAEEQGAAERGTLQQVSGSYYLFTPHESLFAASDVRHDSGHSDFVLDTGSQHQATFQWYRGLAWPSLNMVFEDEDSSLGQWWFPEWFSRFLTAEMASRGRTLSSNLVDRGADALSRATGFDEHINRVVAENVRNIENAIRNVVGGAQGVNSENYVEPHSAEGESGVQQQPGATDSAPRRSWSSHMMRNLLGEFDLADEIEIRQELEAFTHQSGTDSKNCIVCQYENEGLMALPVCKSPICQNCLDGCGRAAAGRLRGLLQMQHWLTGSPEDFSIPCPHRCGGMVDARVIRWDPAP